jgi:hypothetical protein
MVVEVDGSGVDMKNISVNFVFVTADRYTTLALRSSSQFKMENREKKNPE